VKAIPDTVFLLLASSPFRLVLSTVLSTHIIAVHPGLFSFYGAIDAFSAILFSLQYSYCLLMESHSASLRYTCRCLHIFCRWSTCSFRMLGTFFWSAILLSLFFGIFSWCWKSWGDYLWLENSSTVFIPGNLMRRRHSAYSSVKCIVWLRKLNFIDTCRWYIWWYLFFSVRSPVLCGAVMMICWWWSVVEVILCDILCRCCCLLVCDDTYRCFYITAWLITFSVRSMFSGSSSVIHVIHFYLFHSLLPAWKWCISIIVVPDGAMHSCLERLSCYCIVVGTFSVFSGRRAVPGRLFSIRCSVMHWPTFKHSW
jgi:hypothetical protein